MMRFFKALGAGSLCMMGLGLALLIIVQIRPESPAGWAATILLGLAAFATALIAYRWMMGVDFYPADPDDGHGGSYMTGLGFGRNTPERRRSDDDASDI